MNRLSIVVPCFNEENTVLEYYSVCKDVVETLPVETEWWFVDDGSQDETLSQLQSLHSADARVHYISFSRNFGKEAALYAGLQQATGDYVVTMDVDLQDPPDLLTEMYRWITEEGYDCVGTRRTTRRGEPKLRSFFARVFYRLINALTRTNIPSGARDYRMMKRIVADAVVQDSEYNRFSKGIYSWVGFRTKWLSYENRERASGKSKWSFSRLFTYGMDGILAYSTVPLLFTSVLGVIFFVIALCALVFIVVRALLFGDPVAGWPSLVSIVLLLGSLQLLGIGIMGLYISKMYLETKKRQIYIVKEKK